MTETLPAAAKPRSMAIKNLTVGLPERGKIKIGIKGEMRKSARGNEFQPPQKLDHFVITTLQRDESGNFVKDRSAHEKYGDKPVELPVRMIYDDPDLNFPTRYACYKGRTLWCSGDGESAQRLRDDGKGHQTVSCTCERQDPNYKGPEKCKMNGKLSVLLEGLGGVGGVWALRTTSYNSIVGISSSLKFIRSITGGPMAGLPLRLTLRAKQVTDPDGKQQTVYVAGVEFDGDIPALQQLGHQIALDRATTHLSIENIEAEARRLLLAAPESTPLAGDDNDDVVQEFYPDQAAEDARRPTRAEYLGQRAPDSETHAGESFLMVDADGEEHEIDDPDLYVEAVIVAFREAAARGQACMNDIWDSSSPSWARLPEALADQIRAAYGEILASVTKPKAEPRPEPEPEPELPQQEDDAWEMPAPVPVPAMKDGKKADWMKWAPAFEAAVVKLPSGPRRDSYLSAHDAPLATFKNLYPKAYEKILQRIKTHP